VQQRPTQRGGELASLGTAVFSFIEHVLHRLLRHPSPPDPASPPEPERNVTTVEQLEQKLDEAGQPHTLAGAAAMLGMSEEVASEWLYDNVPDLRETLEVLADPELVQRLETERQAIRDGAPTFSIDEVRADLARRRGK
jgi:hypothetical protein